MRPDLFKEIRMDLWYVALTVLLGVASWGMILLCARLPGRP
jgi:hypothetical protein